VAERPVFVPVTKGTRLIAEVPIRFPWHSGMAASQKKKNIVELHTSAAARGLSPLLEVSTKSDEKLGQRLSAFNLKVLLEKTEVPFESAYQGSKVFSNGGPYTDLYDADPRAAKRDPRIKDSGRIVGFRFHQIDFPIFPKTAFYDWLYLNALYPHREFLRKYLAPFKGFTDIEFNPERSLNCQARSCATFIAVDARALLDECTQSFDAFARVLEPDSIEQPHSFAERQASLFAKSNAPAPTPQTAHKANPVSVFRHLNPISVFDAGANQSKIAVALAEILMNWGGVEQQIRQLLETIDRVKDECVDTFLESRTRPDHKNLLEKYIIQAAEIEPKYGFQLRNVLCRFDDLKMERDPLIHFAWQPRSDGFALCHLRSHDSIAELPDAAIKKVDAESAKKLASEIKDFVRSLSILTAELSQAKERRRTREQDA
jgi:hypothetical protein